MVLMDKISLWRILDRLTERQRQVLTLIAKGFSMKEIGWILETDKTNPRNGEKRNRHCSEKTIEYHKYQVMKATGLNSIAELTHFAIKVGLVPLCVVWMLFLTNLNAQIQQPPALPKSYKPATGVTKGSGAEKLMQVVPQAVVVPPRTLTFTWCYPSQPGSDYANGWISFNVYHSNSPLLNTMTLLTNVTQTSVTIPMKPSGSEFFGVKAQHSLTHRESHWGANMPCNN